MKIKEKKIALILSYGRHDYCYSVNTLNIIECLYDIENLSKNELKEKYFKNSEERAGNIWLNGYVIQVTFEDNTDYYYEVTDNGQNCMMKRNDHMNTISHDDIFPEYKKVFELI